MTSPQDDAAHIVAEIFKATRLGVIQGTINRRRKFQDAGLNAAQNRDARGVLRAQAGAAQAAQQQQQTQEKLAAANMGYKSEVEKHLPDVVCPECGAKQSSHVSRGTHKCDKCGAEFKPHETAEEKAGTSAGAKKGWEARQGMRVAHKRYGPGTVDNTQAGPSGKQIGVLFDNPAQKVLGVMPVDQKHLTMMQTQPYLQGEDESDSAYTSRRMGGIRGQIPFDTTLKGPAKLAHTNKSSVVDEAAFLVVEVLKSGNSAGAKKGWENRSAGRVRSKYVTSASRAQIIHDRLTGQGYKTKLKDQRHFDEGKMAGFSQRVYTHPEGHSATLTWAPSGDPRMSGILELHGPQEHHDAVVKPYEIERQTTAKLTMQEPKGPTGKEPKKIKHTNPARDAYYGPSPNIKSGVEKSGSAQGAKKGWETRKRGGKVNPGTSDPRTGEDEHEMLEGTHEDDRSEAEKAKDAEIKKQAQANWEKYHPKSPDSGSKTYEPTSVPKGTQGMTHGDESHAPAGTQTPAQREQEAQRALRRKSNIDDIPV